MADGPRVLTFFACGLVLLFAVFGTAFIVGEAMMDPGGATAVVLTAAWVAPTAALVGYVLFRRGRAGKMLTSIAVVVTGFVLTDVLLGLVPQEPCGRVRGDPRPADAGVGQLHPRR